MSTAEIAIAPTPGRPALRISRCIARHVAPGASASAPSSSGRSFDSTKSATAAVAVGVAEAALAAGLDLDDDDRRRLPLQRAVGLRRVGGDRAGRAPRARRLRAGARAGSVADRHQRVASSFTLPFSDWLTMRAPCGSPLQQRLRQRRRLFEFDVRRQRRHLGIGRPPRARPAGRRRAPRPRRRATSSGSSTLMPVQAEQLGEVGVGEVGDRPARPRASGRPPSTRCSQVTWLRSSLLSTRTTARVAPLAPSTWRRRSAR